MSVTHIYAAYDVKINVFVGEAIMPAETFYYYLFIYLFLEFSCFIKKLLDIPFRIPVVTYSKFYLRIDEVRNVTIVPCRP